MVKDICQDAQINATGMTHSTKIVIPETQNKCCFTPTTLSKHLSTGHTYTECQQSQILSTLKDLVSLTATTNTSIYLREFLGILKLLDEF